MILRWSKMYQGASTQFHTIANLHKALRTILTGCRCQSIAFWILSRSFPCRAAEGSRSRCGLNKWETSWRVWRMPWYALICLVYAWHFRIYAIPSPFLQERQWLPYGLMMQNLRDFKVDSRTWSDLEAVSFRSCGVAKFIGNYLEIENYSYRIS